MTDDPTADQIIAHLREQITELRRLGRVGPPPAEVAERKRLILRLQEHLAYEVRDLLHARRTSPSAS